MQFVTSVTCICAELILKHLPISSHYCL